MLLCVSRVTARPGLPGTVPVCTCSPVALTSRAPLHFNLHVSHFGGWITCPAYVCALRTFPGTAWTLDPWHCSGGHSDRGLSLCSLGMPGGALLHQLIHQPSLVSLECQA